MALTRGLKFIESETDYMSWRVILRDDSDRPEEICTCLYHTGYRVHCQPCWINCPICHLPIRENFFADHPQRYGQYLGRQNKNRDIVDGNNYLP